jgi:hypothetical protein
MSLPQQVRDTRELHARTAGGLAAATLVAVDRLPALVIDEERLALAHALEDLPGRRARSGEIKAAGLEVLQQRVDGLLRALLVRADYSRRAALDPPRDVGAANRAGVADDTPGLVRDETARRVERDAG